MSNQILVAYDHIGPRLPFLNNQNFNVHFNDLHIDLARPNLFEHISGFKIAHTSTLKENDLFIYPLWAGFHDEGLLGRPIDDLFETTKITHETVELIRNHNGYLLIDSSQEASIKDNVINLLHSVLIKQYIPLNKVIFQVGNMSGKEQYNDYCIRHNIPEKEAMHISCLEHFEWMASTFIDQQTHLILKRSHASFDTIKKTFLCLNRNYRWHRINLFLLWNKFNLLDNSYYSMSERCYNYTPNVWSNSVDLPLARKFNITLNDINEMQNKLPLKLDNLREAYEMAQLSGGLDHLYESSLISVVTETNFNFNNDDSCIFNTEKTFKPMIHQQPFIMVGPWRTLAHLKTMGYKTFSNFWDESYDDIVDPKKRLIKIVEICSEINEWDDNRKREFFYASKSVTRHNFKVLKSIYPHNMRMNFWHSFGDNMRVI